MAKTLWRTDSEKVRKLFTFGVPFAPFGKTTTECRVISLWDSPKWLIKICLLSSFPFEVVCKFCAYKIVKSNCKLFTQITHPTNKSCFLFATNRSNNITWLIFMLLVKSDSTTILKLAWCMHLHVSRSIALIIWIHNVCKMVHNLGRYSDIISKIS